MLTCTVKLSPIIQNLSVIETVNIMWTKLGDSVPEPDITFRDSPIPENCSKYVTSEIPVFQCKDSIYKSIAIITRFTTGFYNCTATITVEHQYINNIMKLSNGTRFTNG